MTKSSEGSPGGGHAAESLSLDELRHARQRLQATEDDVSYARRVAQTRLDLVRARLDDADRPVAERLPDVLAHQLLSASGRPPRDTDAHAGEPVTEELEALSTANGFSRLDSLSRDELEALAAALERFERRVSSDRKELFARIDALSADLVRRYRDGSADVDRLWDDGFGEADRG
ncbi:MAG: hypothetical protein M3337_02150 [Actinomycetota bacterium]|nr:hypothetical protein [Actinomycetota bacterium]